MTDTSSGPSGRRIINEGIVCERITSCPNCASKGAIVHENIRDQLFGAPGNWSIEVCTNGKCGMGWLSPMPAAMSIPKLYETYYTHDLAHDPEEQSHELVRAGSGHFKKLFAALLRQRRTQLRSGLFHLEGLRPGRLLEVGCGNGSFLRAALAAGWQTEGIDFDENAVAAASQIPGVRVRRLDVHDPALQKGHFDAIVMNNVIEHLPEPKQVFRRCAELLASNGRLVMITPNLRSLCHEQFGKNWRGLETPRHLYLYTDRSLAALAQSADFKAVETFSSLGGQSIDFMISASTQIAQRAGNAVTSVNPRAMKLKNLLQAIVGRNRGEWVTLVAQR